MSVLNLSLTETLETPWWVRKEGERNHHTVVSFITLNLSPGTQTKTSRGEEEQKMGLGDEERPSSQNMGGGGSNGPENETRRWRGT